MKVDFLIVVSLSKILWRMTLLLWPKLEYKMTTTVTYCTCRQDIRTVCCCALLVEMDPHLLHFLQSLPLSRKESYKDQRKKYRREKKRVARELLSTLKDPAVVVLADWLKVRGSLKGWTKLWCVLKPGMLLLYKSAKVKVGTSVAVAKVMILLAFIHLFWF